MGSETKGAWVQPPTPIKKDSTSDTPQSEEGGSDGSSSEDPSENEVMNHKWS